MEYGLQLYSIRDIMPHDINSAFQAVKAAGYSFVEFAGFFRVASDKVARMLAETGLKASGTHTGLDSILKDYEGTVSYHKAIGCDEIIIPGHDLSDEKKRDDFVRSVNGLLPKLWKDGIMLSYHNHSHEFTEGIYEEIVSRTQIGLELDTYWAYVAGQDPLALMDRLRGRLRFIHLKDGTRDGKGYPLGLGEAPVKEVWKKALEMGIPMVVESETLSPDGITEARTCMDYLAKLSVP